ncbi:MAG: nucleotide exchange factor GrpE [Methanomicrobia archaeon]|nr:nucleotide exchange factor GrpE [Methanomicrobia archaeon]
MSNDRNRGDSRIEEFKEGVARLLNEIGGCIELVEGELSRLSGVKGELNGIVKELERRKAMLELEQEVSDEELEEIGDAVAILEEEAEAKKRKTEEILKGEEAGKYLTDLKYLKAEFENYKRRAEKEKREFADYLIEGVMMELVDVMDNLEAATEHAKENVQSEGLVKGVEMTLKRFKEVLEKEGVTEIKAEGEKFDPFGHEVVSKEVNETYPENAVIEVIRKGYAHREKVVRPALVKIAVKGKR